MNVKASCYKCEKRTSDCHSKCEKYIQFKAERDAELKELRKARSKAGDMYGYQIQKYKRLGK